MDQNMIKKIVNDMHDFKNSMNTFFKKRQGCNNYMTIFPMKPKELLEKEIKVTKTMKLIALKLEKEKMILKTKDPEDPNVIRITQKAYNINDIQFFNSDLVRTRKCVYCGFNFKFSDQINNYTCLRKIGIFGDNYINYMHVDQDHSNMKSMKIRILSFINPTSGSENVTIPRIKNVQGLVLIPNYDTGEASLTDSFLSIYLAGK